MRLGSSAWGLVPVDRSGAHSYANTGDDSSETVLADCSSCHDRSFHFFGYWLESCRHQHPET